MRLVRGLFIYEGSSDQPLAEHVQDLFLSQGVELQLAMPDFGLVSRGRTRSLADKFRVGVELMAGEPDVLVVHRDADAAGRSARLEEIERAAADCEMGCPLVPVVPVRTTEAWLLLNEAEIRFVAGNPRGREPLSLPPPSQAENVTDPKAVLESAILAASGATGRRRHKVSVRFSQNRRQLLQRLDRHGLVRQLEGWRLLEEDVQRVSEQIGS